MHALLAAALTCVRANALALTARARCASPRVRVQAPTIVRRVRPHESGLWSRRYCEVEEVHYVTRWREVVLTTTRRGLRWDEALCELRVPLRALLAFYGERGLRARGFPPWAIGEIRAMGMEEDVA